MFHVRSLLFLIAPTAMAALACVSNNQAAVDAGSPDTAQVKVSDAAIIKSDATTSATVKITIDTSAKISTFTPKLLFGANASWYVSKRTMQDTQAKVQAAGNYMIRYPGGSSSDDFHWNGTGSYDDNHYWLPSSTTYTAGFQGTEMYRGTTSAGYQVYAFLTDGNTSTRWLSNADTAFPSAQWAYVDLGAAKLVDSIQIVWGTPYATSFKVQTWSGTSSWPPPYQATGSNSWQDTSAGDSTSTGDTQTITFSAVTTEFIRVLMTASSAGDKGAYSIAELKAFSGTTQLTKNTADTNQSPTLVSSVDPANQNAKQAGFDFESFMTYLQSFSPAAEAMITVNFGTGTPEEAAAWVHYANVVKKYGIRYWQIGNEMEGSWETGGPLNAKDYVKRYLEFYDAMKAEDSSIVVLGPVSGGINEPSNLGDDKTFIQDFIVLLDAAGKADHLDGIDFHWYPNYGNVTDQAGLDTISELADFSKDLKSWLGATNAKDDVPVFLTEYNMGIGASNTPVYANQLINGLWTANMLGEYARYFGHGGGAFLWQLLAGGTTADSTDSTAGDLGYLQFNNNSYHYQEHASYWAIQMMSSLWAIAGDTRTHEMVATTSSKSSLIAYANLRPDNALTLAVINQDESNAASATIAIAPFSVGTAADVWTFDSRNYVWETSATPYHADPDTAPTHTLLSNASASMPFTFGPASITVIRFAAPGAATAGLPDAGTTSDTITTHNYVLVDDMESTTSSTILLSMGDTGLTAGSWFGAVSTGSKANTISPDPYALSELSSSHETMSGITSNHAAHITCSIADLYGYCQQGFSLTNPETAFDISQYSGVVFWAMSSAKNAISIQIPNDDTVPAGNKCGQTDAGSDQCWDSFAFSVSLTTEWKKFEVKFSDLSQGGWGHPAASGSFDGTTARGINFLVTGPGSATSSAVTADFWIDDIYFE
jgi:hypothetical protein